MSAHRRFSSKLQSAFSVVIMIALWLAFAPTQVGGLASYIIIIGKSMEPNFHIGDLVIVHEQPIYQVGEAVAYQNQELKSFVFHRIISQQLGRYTLKGDNNSWMDNYKPSREEMIGRLWLYIPRGGTAIQKIRNPFVMALITGALGMMVFANRLFGNKTKGNQYMNTKSIQEWFASIQPRTRVGLKPANPSEPKKPLDLKQGEILEGALFALGVIALASLILGMIVFFQPASRVVQNDISYQHLGVFSYAASAPQGVYDANSIKSGDPIFTKLTCSVDVNFQYTLIAAQAENIKGTYQLTAIISEQVSGWQRAIPLQEVTSFTGTSFGTSAKLDLCQAGSLTQSMEQETDFHPGVYTLAIKPNIKLAGEVSNRVLEGAFNSGPVFRYDHLQFYLVRDEEQGNPLVSVETGILREARMEANTMLLLGRELSIPILRWIALFGLLASLCGLGLLEYRMQKLCRFDQERFFHIKYDSVMVDTHNTDWLPSSMVVVNSMDTLAKLAERFNTVILHSAEDNLHLYLVQAGGITYQFRLDAGETESGLRKEETFRQEGEA